MRVYRIAIIGSGAVGSYYGGRLAEAGHDVYFLLRRDYDAISKGGLNITSPNGDFVLPHPQITRDSEEIGPVDWVICALKATAIWEAQKLVKPCVGVGTRILVLMNGLGLEEYFAAWFGSEHVFGGLAFTCINRGRPGHVHHLAHGPINIGHMNNDPAEVAVALKPWANTKVEVSTAPSLLRARWEKLCWNIPISGLSVVAGGITTDRIIDNTGLLNAARTIMKEVITLANADLTYHSEDTAFDHDALIDATVKRTAGMGAFKTSTMVDFVEGRSMEIEAIFGEPLRRAELLGVNVPYLTLLTTLLRVLNHSH